MNMRLRKLLPLLTLSLIACGANADPESTAASAAPADETSVAVFAGGCFWCTESDFASVPGVIDAVSGYTGGSVENPSYEQVSAGGTGHAESVKIRFDPGKISYEQLLDRYWHSIDPTVQNRQFCDQGSQYRSAIFYTSEAQKQAAQRSKMAVEKTLGTTVYTQIVPLKTFYPAEDYHQNYSEKNPIRYRFYRSGCGRDARLEQIWGEQALKH